jgi:uncharacterized protein YigE (DUF2233 family)
MRFIVLAIFFIGTTPLFSQIVEKQKLAYNTGSYDVLIIRVDSTDVHQRLTILANTSLKSEKAIFDSIAGTGLFFAINAGIVDSACNLLGLQILNSNTVQQVNRASGKGNFYLEPNGVFGTNGSAFQIKPTADFTGSEGYLFAIQSGPLLLNANVINNQFSSTSKNRNIRSGVGLRVDSSGHYLIFSVSNVPVNFFEFAELFQQKLKCSDALSLESGSFVSAHFPSMKRALNPTKYVCKYLYLPLK